MLVDKDGHLITQEGSTEKTDTDTISALVAGCFAATREMARILGEEEFTALFHQGRRDNLQLTPAQLKFLRRVHTIIVPYRR